MLAGKGLRLEPPILMGILNLTPDSFSDGGRFTTVEAALAQAERLRRDGADVIDLGAQSTRPGAPPVSPAEESARLLPTLTALRRRWPELPLSIDTQRPALAAQALALGAAILNDVSERSQPAMVALAKEHGCPLVVMHGYSQAHRSAVGKRAAGAPPPTLHGRSAHQEARAIFRALSKRARRLEAAGLASEQIWLDPGFGFGKAQATSAALLLALGEQSRARWPVLVGLSRKRFLSPRNVYLEAAEADAVSAEANSLAIGAGAAIIRTHAVAPLSRLKQCVQQLRVAAQVRPTR